MSEGPRKRWEEDFGPEERLLLAHGFHRMRGLDDAWQLGSADKSLPVDAKVYSREEALKIAKERMGR